MRYSQLIKVVCVLALIAAGFSSVRTEAGQQPTQPQQQPQQQPGAAQNPPAQPAQSAEQERIFQELLKKIAGQENKPAEEVFKNIQVLKGVPAGRLLRIMNMGYSRALGVNCAHCHVVGEWDKDDKPEKQITRDMIKMTGTINNDLLKNIKNLKGPNSSVNCATCHRGQVKPALNLGDSPRRAG